MSSLLFPLKLEDHPLRKYNFTWQGKSVPENIIPAEFNTLLNYYILELIKKDNEYLLHTWQCKDFACTSTNCPRMKKLLIHTDECIKDECNTCRNSLIICYYHAMNCNDKKCSIGFCLPLKEKIQYQEKFQDMIQRNQKRPMDGCNIRIKPFARKRKVDPESDPQQWVPHFSNS